MAGCYFLFNLHSFKEVLPRNISREVGNSLLFMQKSQDWLLGVGAGKLEGENWPGLLMLVGVLLPQSC